MIFNKTHAMFSDWTNTKIVSEVSTIGPGVIRFTRHNGHFPSDIVDILYSLLGNLKYTTVMGATTGDVTTGDVLPKSFAEGITSNKSANFIAYRCHKSGEDSDCKFVNDQNEFESFAESYIHPKKDLFGSFKVGAECARCKRDTNTCEDCECGKDDCTVPRD